jgi:RNA polymerase sigma-70 factor, ECF subfamily
MSDTATIKAIWSDLSHQLRAFIRSKVKNTDDAEDILQEVFLKASLHILALREQKSVSAWMYKLAQNCVVDYYRHRKLNLPTDDLDQYDTPIDTDTRTIADLVDSGTDFYPLLHHLVNHKNYSLADVRRVINAQSMNLCFDDISDEYLEAVLLYEFRDMSLQQLADQFDISLPAIKARVQRGREKIKQAYLRCCDFTFDARGSVMDYHSRNQDCKICS